jgi:hypothetical protein
VETSYYHISQYWARLLSYHLIQAMKKATHLFFITLGILLACFVPHGKAVNFRNELPETVLDEKTEDDVDVQQKVFVKEVDDQNLIEMNLDIEDEVMDIQGIRRDLKKWSNPDKKKKKKKKKHHHKKWW